MGGADANGGNKPNPATQNPMAPCDGERPGCFHWDDSVPIHRPAVVTRQQKQVAEPAGYAVAGKILLAAAGALAGVLLAIVAMYLYNSARDRRGAAPAGPEPGHRRGRRRGPRRRRRHAARARPRRAPRAARGGRGRGGGRLRGLPCGGPAGGEGARAAAVRAPVPRRLHRRLVPRKRHLPALPRRRLRCASTWLSGSTTPLPRLPSRRQPWGRRLPSGTDLDKARRPGFASTRSV